MIVIEEDQDGDPWSWMSSLYLIYSYVLTLKCSLNHKYGLNPNTTILVLTES